MALTEIAVLVPVCSRNQTYTSLEEIPFLKRLYASFLQTAEFGEYNYTFHIGYDDDDAFYKTNRDAFQAINPQFHLYELSGCQHAPAFAWNKLAAAAASDATPYEYFFQVGDDVVLLQRGWTSAFVDRLKAHANLGVVGPCNRLNYFQRVNHGRPYVIENSFVHKTHLSVFDTFFPPTIRNWYCDDWITRVYTDTYREILLDYPCENSIVDARYAIAHPANFEGLVAEGKTRITAYQKVNS
jgi:hypothetical protein